MTKNIRTMGLLCLKEKAQEHEKDPYVSLKDRKQAIHLENEEDETA